MVPTPRLPHAELSTSHRSQVGSLKAFGSSLTGKRMFGSDGDLAASMPVTTPLNTGRWRVVVPEERITYNLVSLSSLLDSPAHPAFFTLPAL